MNPLLVAAKEICDWLDSRSFRSCLIGGMAVQRWGEPRLTRDVDLTVLAEIGSEERIVDACLGRFAARIHDARSFALQNRVLLIRSSNEVDLDLALGASGFEVDSLNRATPHEFAPGYVLRTCSAEDLIVHKSVAGRARDIADLQGVVRRQHANLDLPYLRRLLEIFAEIKNDSELARPLEEALRAAGTRRDLQR